MTDDAIREVHGVKCNSEKGRITIHECEGLIGLASTEVGNSSNFMTPYQARYLAAKLYRLSRRIRQRTEDSNA